ncbi:cell surface lipoprotein [Methanolobus halotolerans]|uniref:Cell surface lipoprotein n=1 Tax=Methanolobus halotolerans TaxID=2052935 RepID=A0A4E0PYP0_9EURY|nr:cell surface lipoprotein [Methanolobus halotolerans]TGC08910.1 cell surface lipoprotein [Methanolobus halotolerans]
MIKKWLTLITILMLAGVLVSGCTDSTENVDNGEETEETTSLEDTAEDPGSVAGDGKDYGVILEYYGVMKPSELELNKGDRIAWRNAKPQGTYVLVSDDGLFEDQEMDHNDMHYYTFTESGTYSFSVKDVPDMTLMVTVR